MTLCEGTLRSCRNTLQRCQTASTCWVTDVSSTLELKPSRLDACLCLTHLGGSDWWTEKWVEAGYVVLPCTVMDSWKYQISVLSYNGKQPQHCNKTKPTNVQLDQKWYIILDEAPWGVLSWNSDLQEQEVKLDGNKNLLLRLFSPN